MKMNRRTLLSALAAASALALLPLGSSAAPNPTKRPLKIGIIGAGWLGGTVGRAWVAAGHEVMFSARDQEKLRRENGHLGERAKIGTPAEAAQFGEVLLFALPYDALPEVGAQLAPHIKGKIVLDAMNPAGGSALEKRAKDETGGSIGLLTAKLLPGTRVARVFSSVDATQIEASANSSAHALAVPLAADDQEALATAEQLVRDAGCDPVVVGKLAESTRYQRDGYAFRVHTDAADLRRRLKL